MTIDLRTGQEFLADKISEVVIPSVGKMDRGLGVNPSENIFDQPAFALRKRLVWV